MTFQWLLVFTKSLLVQCSGFIKQVISSDLQTEVKRKYKLAEILDHKLDQERWKDSQVLQGLPGQEKTRSSIQRE